MAPRRRNDEGSIFREDARGRWVGLLHVDGVRRKVTARTERDVRQKLDKLKADRERGVAVTNANVTVTDVVALWRERALPNRNLAPATVATYEWAADHIVEQLGRKRIAKVNAEAFEQAMTELRDAGLSKSSLVKIRNTAGLIWRWAVRRGLATTVVPAIAELPTGATPTTSRRALTADEARTLLAALEGEPRAALYTLMLTTGLRPGEAAGVSWSALDLDACTLAVSSAVRIEHGRPTLVRDLKTARSRRTIGLPPFLVAALREHRTTQIAERLAAREWADLDLVWATNVGTPLDPAKVRTELARIAADAGLGRVRPNELRHTAASVMSDAGTPIEVVADMLGHTSTRMLELTYRHPVRSSIDAGAQVAQRLYGASAE